jgi:hypothetical protein
VIVCFVLSWFCFVAFLLSCFLSFFLSFFFAFVPVCHLPYHVDLAVLCQGLKNNTSIKTLVLTDNEIGDEGMILFLLLFLLPFKFLPGGLISQAVCI